MKFIQCINKEKQNTHLCTTVLLYWSHCISLFTKKCLPSSIHNTYCRLNSNIFYAILMIWHGTCACVNAVRYISCGVKVWWWWSKSGHCRTIFRLVVEWIPGLKKNNHENKAIKLTIVFFFNHKPKHKTIISNWLTTKWFNQIYDLNWN